MKITIPAPQNKKRRAEFLKKYSDYYVNGKRNPKYEGVLK
jgi:hypothetical protein